MRRILLATFTLLLFAPNLVAQEREDSEVSFKWAGEELYYSIRLNNVEAVRAGVRIGDVRYKGEHPYVPLHGTAHSVGVFETIYPIEDVANTFVSPITLKPLRSEKFFSERGKKKNFHVDFTHSTYRAKVKKVTFKDDKRKERDFSMPIPGTTHDMMTWFFELRNRESFTVGEEMTFYVYDGWKLSKLYARVAAKEDVYTPIGWFKTYRIDFEREILRSKRKKGQEPILRVKTPSKPTGSLWISRDANFIPVKVAVSTKIGTGESVIIKYKLPSAQRK